MSSHADAGHTDASSGSGADTLALVLIVIAFAGAVVEVFYKPFLVALPALVITMVGIRVSDRYRTLGMIAMFAIVLGFLIGASYAVWDSRALY
jgi:hypothetical protein